MPDRIHQWQAGDFGRCREFEFHLAERLAKRKAENASKKRTGSADRQTFDDENADDVAFRKTERLHDSDVVRLFMGDLGDDVENPETCDDQNRGNDGEHDDVADEEPP